MTATMWVFMSFTSGLLLGAVYFASLWGTLHRMPSSKHPFGVLFLWFLVRSAVVIAGFLVVWGGDLNRLVACLSGFVVARGLYVGFFRQPRSEARKLPS